MIRCVLLDVGNVILNLHTREFLDRIQLATRGLTDAAMLAELRNDHCLHHEWERGKIEGNIFWKHLVEKFELQWDEATFYKYWNQYFSINTKIEETVNVLKGKVQLWVLSNTNTVHYDFFVNEFPVFKQFNGIIGSQQTGFRKPENGIFEYTLKKIKIPAEEILFLDDMDINLRAAEKFGFKTFHYTFNDKELATRLKQEKLI